MKLKLNFVGKIPKLTVKNELIFINNKNFRHNILDQKEIISNELFKEEKIIERNQNKGNYILINCIEQKKSSDFENIGSKLFDFLSKNKNHQSPLLSKAHFHLPPLNIHFQMKIYFLSLNNDFLNLKRTYKKLII